MNFIQQKIKSVDFVIIRGPTGWKIKFLNQIGTIDTPTSGTIILLIINMIRLLGQEVNKLSKDSYLSQLRLCSKKFNLIATYDSL
ncbi:unnamed protein product [Paramecium sonneborni]|uniref:Uncharacterized protein n=1 Tax=Paramecium sonneborni TaxID=65129 RepID=A0A8S1RPS8_9CILI|nr:unnamed protein product [Paramecium sonneborni]